MNAEENAGLPRWKRMLDVSLIVLALPLFLPITVVIALIIRITSTGPILFQQERVGYRGQRFMILKFRTMYCGAETVSHQGYLQHLMDSDAPMIKLDSSGDARIIPLGKLLRAAGLDELPQLFNVLNGEMSLVGPRPCLPYEAEQYLPWQRERFNAAPGLTGLWQVNGKNRTTFTRMIQLDIEYARSKSLWLDLKVLCKTLPALLVQIGDLRLRKKILQAAGAEPAMPVRVINQ
ncbi:MAG: sugar transferase [Verrucomicrobiota bacterium]|jgi:lipopolysaccharide/colanic/teichoic acid biosynthesis glycosyltransferase